MRERRLRQGIARSLYRHRTGAVILCALNATGAAAQIATDGTVGGPGNLGNPQILSTAGSAAPVAIGESLGSRPGGGANLFHSFSDFNVNTGQTVTFTGSAGIAHVLSRVTGANASSIDGTLASTIDGADLWLINPNGILFGANASLDLLGSFRATTADYIELADGVQFGAATALPPDPNTLLTVANPVSFGFLGAGAGNISVNGADLGVRYQKEIALVGGDVTLDNAAIRAPVGGVDLISVAGSGEVSLQGTDAGADAATEFGNITLDSTQVRLSGEDQPGDATFVPPPFTSAGGGLYVRAGNAELLDNTRLESSPWEGNPGPIQVEADILTLNDSDISSFTFVRDAGPDIRIDAGELYLSNEASIRTEVTQGPSPFGNGPGGDIDINAGLVELLSESRISTNAAEQGTGGDVRFGAFGAPMGTLILDNSTVGTSAFGALAGSGSLSIFAENLLMRNSSMIQNLPGDGTSPRFSINVDVLDARDSMVKIEPPNRGNGAEVRIDGDEIYFRNSSIDTSTGAFGNAGSIIIGDTRRPETLLLSGPDAFISSSSSDSSQSTFAGASGTIAISAGEVTVSNSAAITNETNDGMSGSITLYVDSFTLTTGARLTGSTEGIADAANITVSATQSIEISDGALISASSNLPGRGTFGEFGGSAGDVFFAAPELSISDAQLLVSTIDGGGGRILLMGDEVDLGADTPGAPVFTEISAQSRQMGDGGDIVIVGYEPDFNILFDELPKADVIRIVGDTKVRADASGGGPDAGSAGNLVLFADTVIVGSDQVSVSTRDGQEIVDGVPTGGAIDVTANHVVIEEDGALFADSEGDGKGGDITFSVADPSMPSSITMPVALTSVSGGTVQTRAGGRGDAGSIMIGSADAPFSIVSLGGPGGLFSDSTNTTVMAGDAGSISVYAGEFEMLEGAQVSVSTFNGAGGELFFDVDSMFMSDISRIDANTAGFGDAGNVTLNASTSLVMTTDAEIVASSTAIDNDTGTPAGAAGSVTIESPEISVESGAEIQVRTADGAGGAIELFTRSLTMLGDTPEGVGGGIFTDTRGTGNAGSLRISGIGATPSNPVASELVLIDGGGFGTGLSSSSNTTTPMAGDAGTVEINALVLRLVDGGEIDTTTRDGEGGTLSLFVDELEVSGSGIFGPSTIRASTFNAGSGGNILIRGAISALGEDRLTRSVLLANGGRIVTNADPVFGTSESGDAGVVSIQSELVTLTGTGSGIFSDSLGEGFGAGLAGSVELVGGQLEVRDGAEISVSTIDGGGIAGDTAGSIAAEFDTINVLDGGSISAQTGGAGRGGTVTLDAASALTVRGGVINTNAAGSGQAGSILITTPSLTVSGEGGDGDAGIFSDSSGTGDLAGPAGILDLQGGQLTVVDGGRLSTSTVDGGEDLTIAPLALGSGRLALEFDEVFVGADGLIAAQSTGDASGGAIVMAVAGTLTVRGGSINTNASATGPAGVILIAAETIDVAGGASAARDGIFSDSSATGPMAGAAGQVILRGTTLSVAEEAEVSVSVVDGQSGQIDLGVDRLVLVTGGGLRAATSGAGDGGVINIEVPDLLIDGGRISTSASSTGNAGEINIGTADNPFAVLEITGDGGFLASDSSGVGTDAGDAGTINVFADALVIGGTSRVSVSTADGASGDLNLNIAELEIRDSGVLTASTSGTASGGDFDLSSIDRLVVRDDGTITAGTSGSGDGGTITLSPVTLEILGGQVTTSTSSTGNAGTIVVGSAANPYEALTIGGVLRSDSTAMGADAGAAGTVQVFARDLTLGEGGGISVSNVDGASGQLTLDTNSLTVNAGASIVAQTEGTGAGGTITLNADESVSILGGTVSTSAGGTGDAGEIEINAPVVLVSGAGVNARSGVFSDSLAEGADAGAAGQVTIRGTALTVSDEAELSVSVVDGASGQIELDVDSLRLTDGGSLRAATDGAGQGGTIDLQVPDLVIEGGRISTSASSTGDAGTINVGSATNPFGLLEVAGLDGLLSSGSSGTGADAGAAGTINVFARALLLGGTSQISVSTADGRSGALNLNVESLEIRDSGLLTASTAGTAAGGDIDLSRINRVTLRDNGTISAGTSGSGDGGTITLAPGALEFDGGQVTTSASSSGDAGTINLGAPGATQTPLLVRGIVRSDSTGTGTNAGAAGTVNIYADALVLEENGQVSVSTVDGQSGQLNLFVEDLTLRDSATLTASTAGAATGGLIDLGQVRVLTLEDNGTVTSGTSGSGDGGTISVNAEVINFNGGQVTTSASSTGNAGTIAFGSADAPLSPLLVQGLISSDSTGAGADAGAAGTVQVYAQDLVVADGGRISVSTVDGGSGQIDVNVDTLAVNAGGTIVAQTSGAGAGGTIVVNANGDRSNTVEVVGGTINTNALASGDAGQILVEAATVTLRGDDGKSQSGIFSDSTATGDAAGAAGTVDMRGDLLSLADGGEISVSTVDGASGQVLLNFDTVEVGAGGTITAQTSGSGDGGTVAIGESQSPVGNVTVLGGSINTSASASGAAGQVAINAHSVTVSGEGSSIASDSTAVGFDAGAAGTLQIAAADLDVNNNGLLSVSTVDGAGGEVNLGVERLTVAADGRITASTAGAGDGGTVRVGGRDGGSAQRVEITGGEIATSTTGTGNAGAVLIDAEELIVSGEAGIRGGLFSESGTPVANQAQALGRLRTFATAGSAGSLSLNLTSVTMTNGAQFSVQSFGDGDAGSIDIMSAQMTMDDSSVNAQTSTGAGGSVSVSGLTANFTMVGSSITAFSASGDPDSQGSISIDNPPAIILERSEIRALSANESGGNVRLEADAIIFDAQSVIEGSGEVFTSGDVLATVVEVKEPEIVDVTEGLADRCSQSQVQNRSSLTIQSIPPEAVRSSYLGAANDSELPANTIACAPLAVSAD